MLRCGHGEWEQEDDGDGHMTLRCCVCGEVEHLSRYRDEGEDKWRDDRDERRRGY